MILVLQSQASPYNSQKRSYRPAFQHRGRGNQGQALEKEVVCSRRSRSGRSAAAEEEQITIQKLLKQSSANQEEEEEEGKEEEEQQQN
ncbi:hypothetical protein Taro_016084 [Colocasia esculenta]|uniref:Uncharacterized protein n=1 Tax=Colocasia esculenta TaxID=4460 RepID=A0A843UJP1_COLES|nr:hypothetical protein [Colocasia esculenta]